MSFAKRGALWHGHLYNVQLLLDFWLFDFKIIDYIFKFLGTIAKVSYVVSFSMYFLLFSL